MESMYVLLLLSIFTATIAVGVAGIGSHDDASITGTSTLAVAANEYPLQRRRRLQTLNYRANYTADFQHLLSPSCTGDTPVLGITCYGQNMEISSVSHPSIVCSERDTPLVENGTSYQCFTTCINAGTCADVYRTNDGLANTFDGVYGSILFMCEGNTIQDVKAEYILTSQTNTSTGSCIADSSVTERNNLRVARLGVSCPISNGDGFDSSERSYVFDDTYFECRTQNVITDDTASSQKDAYACFNGQQCDGQGCSITFFPIQVLTHVPSFANECVQTMVPIDGFPTAAPQAETSLYKVRFEASWTTQNPDSSSCGTTSVANPAIQIACNSNVGSTIVYVNATGTNMDCFNKHENVLQCTGDAGYSINRFATVVYDCFSSNIPSSTVTYPDSSAYCQNNVNETYIGNWVSLRIMCDKEFLSLDAYLECSDSHHSFDIVDVDPAENLVSLRYLCGESTLFSSNSLASNIQTIRNVSITTEEYWQRSASSSCYQQLNIDTTRPPVTITVPTLAPILAPNQATAQPEPGPTVAPAINTPVSAPSAVSGVATPVTIPTVLPESITPVATPQSPTNLFSPAPTIPTGDILTAPSKGDGDNKVLIFAAVGGVVGGIIVFVLLFMVYNKGKNDAVAEYKDEAFPSAKENNDTDNNTESHHSPSMQQSSNQTDSGSPTILSVAALASPIETTPSDFYEVHYKDQSRSVIDFSGRTQSGRSSNNDKTHHTPVLARYYKAENVQNPKPTSGIEIPTVTAIMCTDISMLGESDSSIRRFADSNSSLRMLGQSNRSFRLTTASNSSIPTESDTDKIYSDTRKEPPASALLADSNSSLQMVGEFNRSFHILDDSSSTIPTESNAHSSDYNRKKPVIADPNSSFRLVDESNRSPHALEDSNSTIPTQSNAFSSIYNRKTTVQDSNSSLRMVSESNRSFQNLEDSNSTIQTESNTASNNSIRKKPAIPSSALEL